ncbi:FAD-dependent oxidoreductase [Mesorhizobium sp. Root554]|uniref:NAD(P)/FAD-dependent oxidoreductase n=1 Tax=unclassified Mesorhizobium TaxID=325217 RepID=UPI0006F942E2|nr:MULTISPECIES: FAD-dependent oxidoreductase [unclassified Mesorhizobium]KQZ14446.1 FAD-dependent oxidoreductase [Mesorhizobium sp. Root1471]KQZ36955.1 FAD-dependent oxidoreductase [Mesorhizobium sp. Root554]
MKRKLDLRTGRPVWFAYRAATVPTEKLTRDIKTDVLVVGMGVSGAMIAEALTARGHAVVCIDRRGPLKGSTAATTALVQFEIDQPLTTLSGMIGKEKAMQAWRRSRLAVSNLQGRIAELGIDCRLVARPSLYLAGDVMGSSELETEARARRQAGIGAFYLPRKALEDRFGIKRPGAVLSRDNLALDPRMLTAGLLLKTLERGARFYAPVEAAALEDDRDGVTVATKSGPTIRARHLVLATGYELMDMVPRAKHQIISTWAIATRPQKQAVWPEEAFIWEASDPYLYMRTTADGRVICGGEDEDFSDEEERDRLIPAKSARIAAKLSRLFPGLDTEPEFSWAGAFGTTTTGLPYIGAIPRHPRIHAVMGYGGNGITFSQIASEVLASALDGVEDADAALFGFNR